MDEREETRRILTGIAERLCQDARAWDGITDARIARVGLTGTGQGDAWYEADVRLTREDGSVLRVLVTREAGQRVRTWA